MQNYVECFHFPFRAADPIFKLYSPLLQTELSSTSKKILQIPAQLEPNQFSQAVIKRNKLKKKVSATNVYRTIKSLLEKDQGSAEKFMESANVSGIGGEDILCSSNTDGEIKPPCSEKPTENVNRQSKIKSEHPVLFSRLDLSKSSEDNLHEDLSKTVTGICEQYCCSSSSRNLQKCTCSSEKTVDASKHTECNYQSPLEIDTQIPNSDHMYSNMSNSGAKKEETSDSAHADACTVLAQMQGDSTTPISPVTSLPGWFGKGCNPRKRKRKL